MPSEGDPDDRAYVAWDCTLLCNRLFRNFKSLESLRICDTFDTVFCLDQLPSLCHLELEQEQDGKVSVLYSVDQEKPELRQLLYNFVYELFYDQAPQGKGPNLKSLKIPYTRATVNMRLPKLKALQEQCPGFEVSNFDYKESCLNIAIKTSALSVNDIMTWEGV